MCAYNIILYYSYQISISMLLIKICQLPMYILSCIYSSLMLHRCSGQADGRSSAAVDHRGFSHVHHHIFWLFRSSAQHLLAAQHGQMYLPLDCDKANRADFQSYVRFLVFIYVQINHICPVCRNFVGHSASLSNGCCAGPSVL